MKVLEKGKTPDGIDIQIEEWHENYDFMPYGRTLASYPISKTDHDGAFAPKRNKIYRFSFDFISNEEAKTAFGNLLNGETTLSDYRNKLDRKEYADCI